MKKILWSAILPSQPHRVVAFLAILTLFSVLPLSAIIVFKTIQTRNLQARAELDSKNSDELLKRLENAEFMSNELLVKFKPNVLGSVREGQATSVGLGSLEKVNAEIKAQDIKKVVRENKNSKKGEAALAWYKVTLEGERKKVKGSLIEGIRGGSTTFDKNNPGVRAKKPVDASVKKLTEAYLKLAADPSVESVDFNYIVSRDQIESTISGFPSPLPTPTPTPTPTPVPTFPPLTNTPATCSLDKGQVPVGQKFTVSAKDLPFGDYRLALRKDGSWPVYLSTGYHYTDSSTEVLVPSIAEGTYTLTIEDSYNKLNGVVKCSPDIEILAPLPSPTPVPCGAVNDPYYFSSDSWGQGLPDLWGLKKMDVCGAWEISKGSKEVKVAVVDTGVDYNHEDISSNIWTNVGEIAGDGIDNDGNGYVDDMHGWDFANGDSDPVDDDGHGTHVAGTIGAVGNNGVGVVGVNWETSIMAVKFLDADGYGTLDGASAALIYAADNGAKVINNSWGCPCRPKIISDSIKYVYNKGALSVTAAGNSSIDATQHSPSLEPDSLVVGSSDGADKKSGFSNWGGKLDVDAPGGNDRRYIPGNKFPDPENNILSLKAANSSALYVPYVVGDKYLRLRGTSMATPQVAGLAALILSKHPEYGPDDLRVVIANSTDDIEGKGFDLYSGSGRVNARKALESPVLPKMKFETPANFDDANAVNSLEIRGTAAGASFAQYKIAWANEKSLGSWNEITSSQSPITSGLLAKWDLSSLETGYYILRLEVLDKDGRSWKIYKPLVRERWVSGFGDQTCMRYDPAISGDNVVYLDNRDSCPWGMNVYLYNLKNKQETKLTEGGGYRFWTKISGNKVAWVELSPGSNIVLYDLETKEQKVALSVTDQDSGYPGFYDLSEEKIVLGGSNLLIYDIATGQAETINVGTRVEFPVIYGDKVAFHNVGLNLYDLKSKTLTKVDPKAYFYDISKDLLVYYCGDYLYDFAVCAWSTNTKTLVARHKIGGPWYFSPNPQFDGNVVVWEDFRDERNKINLYSYDLSSKKERRVAVLAGFEQVPLYPYISNGRIVWNDYRITNQSSMIYNPPQPVVVPVGKFRAEYFNKPDFTDKVLERVEDMAKLNGRFDTVPVAELNNDNSYSIKWEGNIDFAAGKYRINANPTLDSIKIFVDDKLLVEGTAQQNALVDISSGVHKLRFEYVRSRVDRNFSLVTNYVNSANCFDLTGDFKITSADQFVLTSKINSKPSNVAPWDLNNDGVLNSGDQLLLAQNFGKSCS